MFVYIYINGSKRPFFVVPDGVPWGVSEHGSELRWAGAETTTPFSEPFCSENNRFTKTGSGQT
jgi:hypothetical protein